MVNTINESQERNKQLLEENENLKKQLEGKEENFKLRIWNAVHSFTKSLEYTGVTLRTLERSTWPNNSWVSYPKKDGIEIERVTLNIVQSFSKKEQNYEEFFSITYQKKQELKEKNVI